MSRWAWGVFPGAQSFCFTRKSFVGALPTTNRTTETTCGANLLFRDVFFSRRFWTHIGPLWIYLFVLRSCRCFISPPANAFQGPLHLLGTKKGLNTENAGVLRQNGRFNKMPQVFWYGCHFERCRSWWSLEVGKPGRGRRLGKCQPVEREQASGESPQQKRVRFCFQVGERLKKSPRYG